MVVQLQLSNLVDLALCDPEIGAVNFNHLRTLLHCMLKLTNHANSLVEPTSENNNSIIISNNVNSDRVYCEQQDVIGTSVIQEGEPKVSLQKDIQEVSCISSVNDAEHINEVEFNRLLLNQNNLENRILTLEKNLQANEEFPSNYEILNEVGNCNKLKAEAEGEEISTTTNEDDSKKLNNRLSTIWQNKKILRRIEATEEAIDKLFSLMNDILNQQSGELITRSEYENMKNQVVDMQNHLDIYTQDVSNCKDNIQSNTSLIEECLNKVGHLGEKVNEYSSNVEDLVNTNLDCKSKETMQIPTKCYTDEKIERKSSGIEKLNSNLAIDIDKFVLMLDEKADLCELQNKVNNSELDNKADTADLEVMQNEIIQLKEEVTGIKEKLLNLTNNSDLDDLVEKGDMNKLVEKLELHVTKTDSTFSEVRRELAQLRQSIANIDDEKLRDMLDNIGELKKLSDKKEEMDAIQRMMQDILIQMEQNKKLQNKMVSELDDLNRANENMMNSQNELRMSIPTLDTSVVAAIQHLTQENRHQITVLQTNIKMLQKSQMPIQLTVPKNDTSGNSDNQSIEMLDILQNHFLTLQEEQVKQSGHISNMVDDYKEEFNRKQLHIDALYDYIDKLQHIKADRDDITVEMNIKADKQSLDNKVNMSTFDERYQMLEESLQQALSRLDQYVEEETLLKGAFSKLSEDMDSKMDSDAERKLKKFLDARLKEIQVSRTHLPAPDERCNAAGLRRPMPLSYNCLSCDRPIDVTMRGVMPPIPNYLPSKKPLGSIKNYKDDVNQSKRSSSSSYNAMVVNRSCGGSHTSVNINMLRMIKLNPLQIVPDSEPVAKTSENELSVADCVIGNDGQIYRGRFKMHSNHKQKGNGSKKHRMTHSAKTLSKHTDSPKVDGRSYSATCIKNDSDNSFSLPPITRKFDVDLDSHHSTVSLG